MVINFVIFVEENGDIHISVEILMMNQFITLLTVSAYVFSANVLTVVVVNVYKIAAMIVVNISNSAAVMGA